MWCPQVSLTRSPPFSVDDQGEGLLLNSYDRTLVVKQISSEDVADMHNILSEYHQVRLNNMSAHAVAFILELAYGMWKFPVFWELVIY